MKTNNRPVKTAGHVTPQRRPQSCPRLGKRRGSQVTPSFQNTESETFPEEYHIELLEYEWPDLPPIPCIKDAISRSRISCGINYLLPVDKDRNSISSQYRTDLRAMFQKPYTTEFMNCDSNHLMLNAKVHLMPSHASRQTKQHYSIRPEHLGSDLSQMRKFLHSASSTRTSTPSGFDFPKRLRSKLFLPVKVEVTPEASKLRKEVQEMIKSLWDESKSEEKELKEDKVKTCKGITEKSQEEKTSKHRHLSFIGGDSIATSGPGENRTKIKPLTVVTPKAMQNQFLPEEKQEAIWNWLQSEKNASDSEYLKPLH